MDNYNIFYQSVGGCYCYDLIRYDEFLGVSLKIHGCGVDIWELGNIGRFVLLLRGMMGVFVGGLTVGYCGFGNLCFLLILMLHLLPIVLLNYEIVVNSAEHMTHFDVNFDSLVSLSNQNTKTCIYICTCTSFQLPTLVLCSSQYIQSFGLH